jgi:UDPglucose 6-dehydrogenase
MRIAVVGSGYVGLVSAACFAELGHDVVCIDNDQEKLAILRNGGVTIHENLLPELLKRHVGQRLIFSDSLAAGIAQAEVVFITVGTPPSVTGEADLSYVEMVARDIALYMDSKKLVVEKSTVPVETCDQVRRVMQLHGMSSDSFSVASNPEFLREGTAVVDFLYPDRIVLGVDDTFGANILQEVYAPLADGSYYKREDCIPGPEKKQVRVIVTSTKSAELIKHASNAFLAMKISYINAVANIAESVGANINQVCEGLGSDNRIGPQFLNAGLGYGGSCFPKDVLAFLNVAEQCGYPFQLLESVMQINEDQRVRFIQKVKKALWTIRGKRIAALGLAFKGGTDDIRDSPAIDIIERLIELGATVAAYDPAAMERARAHFKKSDAITFAENAYDAAKDADAVLILTEWQEFAELDLARLRELVKLPIIVDGRNLYKPEVVLEAGFHYHSVGRAHSAPSNGEAREVAARGVIASIEKPA